MHHGVVVSLLSILAIPALARAQDCGALSDPCRTGDAAACAREANHARFGRPADPPRARCADARACELGNGASCVRLGQDYARGEGVGRDRAEAERLYARACELDHGTGCGALSNLLRDAAAGAPPDPAQDARQLAALGRACALGGGMYCHSLLEVLRGQRLPEAQEQPLVADLRQACRRPEEHVCEHLRVRDALASAESSCRRGRAASCNAAGSAHAAGIDVARDTTRAAELWDRGCAGRDGLSCLRRLELGRAAEGAVPLPDADDFTRRALPALEATCRGRARVRDEPEAAQRACEAAAEIRWSGLGVSPDARGAIRILESAGADGLSVLSRLYVAAPDEPTRAAVERAMSAMERRTPGIDQYMIRPLEGARRSRAEREASRVACEAGSLGACVQHAESEPFPALVQARLDALCADFNGAACVARARDVSERPGRERADLERQRHYTSAADARCTAGQPSACVALARFYREGAHADVPRSDRLFDAAVEHVRTGCRTGDASACEVARYLSIGHGDVRRELAPDDRRPLLARSCELGDGEACDAALRLVHGLPEGHERDALTLRLARRGCALGVFGPCRALMVALERGRVPDGERAAVTEELAAHCRAGIDGSCLDD